MTLERSIESRPPNWLPIPGVDATHFAPVQHVDENDLFSKGEITSFFPNQRFGYIKDMKGRALRFSLDECDISGTKRDAHYFVAGSRVGYDVFRTSNGVRVSRLKIY